MVECMARRATPEVERMQSVPSKLSLESNFFPCSTRVKPCEARETKRPKNCLGSGKCLSRFYAGYITLFSE